MSITTAARSPFGPLCLVAVSSNPSAALRALYAHGELAQALYLLQSSLDPPDEDAYVALFHLYECCHAADAGMCAYEHADAVHSSFGLRLGNAMLNMLVRFGESWYAWRVFAKMPQQRLQFPLWFNICWASKYNRRYSLEGKFMVLSVLMSTSFSTELRVGHMTQNEISQHNDIIKVKVICHPVTKESKGYDFIKFSSENEAAAELQTICRKVLNGRSI